MDIRFQRATAHADVGLAAHARRCLLRQMQERGDRVDHLDVAFVDAGLAPRRDSYCIVRVQLRGYPAATVVDVGTDVRSVIDRAADRVGRLAQEQLRRGSSPQASQTEAEVA